MFVGLLWWIENVWGVVLLIDRVDCENMFWRIARIIGMIDWEYIWGIVLLIERVAGMIDWLLRD
jgi:hypothetical protein